MEYSIVERMHKNAGKLLYLEFQIMYKKVRKVMTLAFFQDEKMIGLAMGCIRHWYEGTEYHIDELCISTNMQGKGIGTEFIRQIEGYMKTEGLSRIFLQTDRGMPAYEFYKKRGFEEMQNHVSFVKSML